jgi:hypothetical protein
MQQLYIFNGCNKYHVVGLRGLGIKKMVNRDTLDRMQQEEFFLTSEEEESDFEDRIDSGAANAWEVAFMANADDY